MSADYAARVAVVTSLYDHFGRSPLPTTVAEVVRDTERWSLDHLRRAAVDVRRETMTLRDVSLSALLCAGCRRIVSHDSQLAAGAARALPNGATPATPEQRAAAVARVRRLSARMSIENP